MFKYLYSNFNINWYDYLTPPFLQFPKNSTKPNLVLGTHMEPGHDQEHFCMPTSVAVSELTGDFFVADGYCNSRVMKFNKDGKLIKVISKLYNLND